MSITIECTLAGNAIDYLLLAGEQANAGSPRMTKHAMATLWDGMELLLKARLDAHDWAQVFNKPQEADQTKFENGDFYSVGFVKLIRRLDELCGIEIDHRHEAVLERLRKTRNKIRHFAVTIDHAAAISLIVKAYSFALEFIGEELDQFLGRNLARDVEQLRLMLSEFKEFVDHRLNEIQSEMESNVFSVYLECPICLQETLYADGGEAICLFCERRRDGESVAEEFLDRHSTWMTKDRYYSHSDLEDCPECRSCACIHVGKLLDMDVSYVCLYCGESGDYARCDDCDRLYSGENIVDRCDDCYGDLMDRND